MRDAIDQWADKTSLKAFPAAQLHPHSSLRSMALAAVGSYRLAPAAAGCQLIQIVHAAIFDWKKFIGGPLLLTILLKLLY
jgi:hypothetical protein